MRFHPLAVCCALAVQTGACLAQTAPGSADSRAAEIRELRQELQRISARLSVLEAASAAPAAAGSSEVAAGVPTSTNTATAAPAPAAGPPAQSPTVAASEPAPTLRPEDAINLRFLRGTTFGFGIDGYYGYNFNQPSGRVNVLRAYDVSSNSFSLNQANIIVEHLPTAQERVGGRIDLMWGQATESLQGNPANELRPQVYRNLYQAYGSYLAPVGSGLQIDFGKFASSLGNEGSYTKDQITYSRAFSFDYLPYYHMGVRANYAFTPKMNLTYWLVNGVQQTEDFNGFKSQGFLLNLKPSSSISWNVNYYFGQEQPDVTNALAPAASPVLPQPGLPTANISPAPNGREHIFDTYATWNATRRWTLIGEADFVLNRVFSSSQPGRVAIGSLMTKYALPKDWNLGGRFEYFDDRSGLFSGRSQALKEITFSADHTFTPGFLARAEYRRDFSNQKFFLSDQANVLHHAQTTATLGLVYWWGTKQGSW